MKNLLGTKHFVAALVVAFFTVINAFGQDEDNKPSDFFININDEKIYIYGDKIMFYPITGRPGSIKYIDVNGKDSYINEDQIKLFVVNNDVSIGIPNKKGKIRMERIVAFNNNYLLTENPFSFISYKEVDIRKRDDLTIIMTSNIMIGRAKKDANSLITDMINTYLPECPELLEKQLKNIEDGFGVNDGISYYNCGNANDYFTNKPVEKEETTEESKPIEEEDGYILTTKGEKLKASSILREPQDFIHYYEKAFKGVYSGLKIIHAGKVKYFKFGKKLYLPLKNSKGAVYMMEVLVYSNDRVLVYDHSKKAYNVYDRNNVLLVNNIKKEAILPIVQEHFSSCKDVVSQMEENVKFHREALSGFFDYNCNNVPTLITE